MTTGDLIPYMATQHLNLDGPTGANAARDALQALGDRDFEKAHSIEDAFVWAVIQAIADGHPDPVGLAKSALVVHEADFARYTA
jgi:hypothetical protein